MPLGDVESLNVPSLVIVIDGVVHITSTSASLLVSELPEVRYFCFVRNSHQPKFGYFPASISA
jgi:hypothetical protein